MAREVFSLIGIQIAQGYSDIYENKEYASTCFLLKGHGDKRVGVPISSGRPD